MNKFLVIVTGYLALMTLFIILSLLFIKVGWTLFMVPVFGLPELTWLQALGFSFLASSFKTVNSSSSKS